MNKATLIFITITLGVFAALAWWLSPELIHSAWAFTRSTWIVFLPALLIAAAGALALFINRAGIAALTWIVAATWLIGTAFYVPYLKDTRLAETVTVSDESPDDLSFRERAPFDVASATSNRTLGDTAGDATGTLKAIPAAGDNGEYTTSVIRRGIFKGYESTQTITPPLFGSSTAGDVRFCDFSDGAELRFGGKGLNNNLARAIAHKTSLSTTANRDDAFVVCHGDTPKVYAPLTRPQGFAITVSVPAGVAIYNGKTGELTIEDNYTGPLPVYPSSLAQKQREATTAMNGFTDQLFGRAGFEDTGKDEDDPNGANRAEFGLAAPDGKTQSYVTPLNSRGSSSSIIALGHVEASTMKAGQLNQYTVNKYPRDGSRQANSAVAASITGEVLGGYKAQGLTVFEIVPGREGSWVASIGKSQSILYRAQITPDGKITLIDESGDTEDPEDAEVRADKPLDDMTADELRELGDQILEELASRTE